MSVYWYVNLRPTAKVEHLPGAPLVHGHQTFYDSSGALAGQITLCKRISRIAWLSYIPSGCTGTVSHVTRLTLAFSDLRVHPSHSSLF
ncbi:hypothetical protein DENSPDRAFT_841223 [Dentipellis sp. KUC8613]|nr:hypothetical protein DENSPDRAFT_841223 [Dentipellis sp. KUC8613]